jgi:hypothetical protein
MTLIELARKLRPYIEKAAMSLSDEDALEAIDLYPIWSGNGVEYKVDDRVRYEQILYKVLIAHTSQEGWTPISAPSLFAKVLIPSPDVIPDWEQPGSTNPYMRGDKVRFEGHVYESTIDNNIWSPSAYPAGWSLID